MRKLPAIRWAMLVLLLLTLLGATPANATTTAPAPTESAPTEAATDPATQEPEAELPELVRARVRTEDGEDVAGVDVVVERDGSEVGVGVTDAEGVAEIGLAEAGPYDIRLDVESLPADVAELEPRQNPIATTVNSGQPRTVAFRLGEAGRAAPGASSGTSLAEVAQLTAQGLRFGLIIALASIGLSLIFGTTGLTNFAHGELVTVGALVAYFFNVTVGMPLVVAAAITLVVSGLFGYGNDRLLWGPLRSRGTGLIAMMIVSIGLAIVLRYGALYVFGGSTRSYGDYVAQRGIDLGLVTLRPIDLFSMGLAVVVLVLVGVALLRTRLGKATRAVSDNPALASASGIDVDRVIQTVWVAGTVLAGLAGILLGMAQGLNFQMGQQVLLLVFAAVVLGGLGTAFGALAGSIVVGLFIELSTLVVPTELKSVGALGVLILILLVRPQGLLGRRERVG